MSQCTARNRRTKERCEDEAMPGVRVCARHGGLTRRAVEKGTLAVIERALDAYVSPIGDDDPEADPAHSLYVAHKKCVARIRWIERRLAETLDADSMEWGLTKEEHKTATEFAGTDRTYEARTPVLVDLLHREEALRVRLVEAMSRQQFKAAEEAQQAKAIKYAQSKVLDLIVALGRKPEDPRVQRAVARVLGGGGARQQR